MDAYFRSSSGRYCKLVGAIARASFARKLAINGRRRVVDVVGPLEWGTAPPVGLEAPETIRIILLYAWHLVVLYELDRVRIVTRTDLDAVYILVLVRLVLYC